MLSWLTGAKGAEESEVPDAFAEPPETPAPVFAVRAFKHAIFGTPAPERDDFVTDMGKLTKEEYKPRNATVNISRRSMDDHDTLALPSAPGLSPSKPNGILLTPGTTRRSKTVSFGAHVVDNEGKKQGRSDLPNTCPGRFPSPWTPKIDFDGLGQSASESDRPRTKLTAQLHEVRDSAQKEKSERIVRAKDDNDLTLDFMEPRSQSGKYWKHEYQSYAEKTQREMKKLVIKQKAAKDFARQKEEEANDLTAQLRQERTKVEKLEAKTAELAASMKEFEKKLMARTSQDARDEIASVRAENQQLRQDLDRALGRKSTMLASPKHRSAKGAAADDIWADAVFSSPLVHDAETSPKANQQSPLRARDINVQDSYTPKSTKNKPSKHIPTMPHSLLEDTLDMSLALPQPSPEPIHRPTPRRMEKSAVDMTMEELVERYSPQKPRAASPSAHFDRLAMPIGMGAPDFGAASAQKKSSMSKMTATQSTNANLPETQVTANNAAPGAEEQSKKRILSDERKAKALARITARKQAKAAAC